MSVANFNVGNILVEFKYFGKSSMPSFEILKSAKSNGLKVKDYACFSNFLHNILFFTSDILIQYHKTQYFIHTFAFDQKSIR